jgi:two-component system CheB/CheR fusion protein
MIKDVLASMETALKQLQDINVALDEALVVAVTDQKGTIIFANQKFCEISKYSRDELLGQNHRIVNSGYHSEEFFRNMWRTIASGKIWRGEIRNRAKDGTYYWVDTTIVPLLDERGKPYRYVSFRVDITERKKAEELLRKSEKIATLGELASGLAHEIRNPLAAIKMSLQAMAMDGQGANQTLDLVLAELDRIDAIVGEFLLLSKPHEVQFHEHDLCQLVHTVVDLMRVQATNQGITLTVACDEDVPQVRCEPNQLKQVVINLIKNAMEAMPDGGTVEVQVKRHSPSHVVVRVRDEGCGIPEDLIPRLTEPFYTTKPHGTGLGLSICQKIISDHAGSLDIHSKVNEGTTIDVILPIQGP